MSLTEFSSSVQKVVLQAVLLHTLRNSSRPLRQTGGTSVAVIVGIGGLQDWPELIAAFTLCLESNEKNSLEGALDALYKVHPSQYVQARKCRIVGGQI